MTRGPTGSIGTVEEATAWTMFLVTGAAIFIKDDGTGESVRNTAQRTVEEVVARYGARRDIVWCDSSGEWYRILHAEGRFLGFAVYRGRVPDLRRPARQRLQLRGGPGSRRRMTMLAAGIGITLMTVKASIPEELVGTSPIAQPGYTGFIPLVFTEGYAHGVWFEPLQT